MECGCKTSCCSKTPVGAKTKKLDFSLLDLFKALYCWLRSYRQAMALEPGLYYTGNVYDRDTPLLVSCNYHLTVFMLWRIIRSRNVRILIIDTKGINVWCSAGKGQFSAKEIFRQLELYPDEILKPEDAKLQVVLPKLSLSGVSLKELRDGGLMPVIGPVYVSDLPAWLDEQPLQSCKSAVYRFDLGDRSFSLAPSMLQFAKYIILIAIGLFALDLLMHTGFHWQVIPLSLFIGISYILLFPLLPTRSFALKGLILAGIISLALGIGRSIISKTDFNPLLYGAYFTYIVAISLFFGLYYTGNSGVSNYSLVKKEIIRFLPVAALFFLGNLSLIIIQGVIG